MLSLSALGRPLWVALLGGALTSCASQKPYTAELSPRSLKAINLEETMSRRDEVMLAYSLTAFDAQNKPVSVVNGGWGVQSMQKGGQVTLEQALPVRLEMPRNGKIVAALVLIEVDDHQQAQSFIARIRKVHNIISTPAALLLTTAEVLTPLKYVAAGLSAVGIGFQLIDQLDNDDVLGQSSVELNDADLRKKRQKSRLVRVPTKFTGSNLRDSFDYELEYDVVLKTLKVKRAGQ